MISVDDVIKIVAGQMNKPVGKIAPDFNKYAPLASIDLFNFYLGSPKTLGRQGRIAYPKNQIIHNKLRHLIVDDYTIALTAGRGEIPDGLVLIDTISTEDFTPVIRCENNQWGTRHKSVVFAPTVDYPIYRELDTEIEVSPSVANVLMNYLRLPQTPKWAYTIESTKPVYDQANSKDFEFPETEKLNIISRILKYMGITIRESELIQFAQVENQTNS